MTKKIKQNPVTQKHQPAQTVDIAPDVRLLRVLRNSGFNTLSALGELLDNSLDAGASHIEVNAFLNHADKKNIMVIDNGKGMNATTLQYSLTMAKELKVGIDQLGKYGMGMKTASLSFSTMFEIYTKTYSGDILFGEFNINKMEAAGDFQAELRPATEEEQTFFWDKIGKQNRSGTILLIKNCDRFDPSFAVFVRQMETFIGLTYQHFIRKGTTFTLSTALTGSKTVKAIDVLMRNHEETFMAAERETFPVEYIQQPNGKVKTTFVEMSVALLPKPDKVGRGKTINGKEVDLPINQTNQGIYVYREGRMVGQALTWSDVTGERHNSRNRIRIEIHCKSDLDDVIGMNFQKGNVNPNASLKNQWKEALAPLLQKVKDEMAGSPEEEGKERETGGRRPATTSTPIHPTPTPTSGPRSGEKTTKQEPKWDDSEDWIKLARKLRGYLDNKHTPIETKGKIQTILTGQKS